MKIEGEYLRCYEDRRMDSTFAARGRDVLPEGANAHGVGTAWNGVLASPYPLGDIEQRRLERPRSRGNLARRELIRDVLCVTAHYKTNS